MLGGTGERHKPPLLKGESGSGVGTALESQRDSPGVTAGGVFHLPSGISAEISSPGRWGFTQELAPEPPCHRAKICHSEGEPPTPSITVMI